MSDQKQKTERRLHGKIKFICYDTKDMVEVDVETDEKKVYLTPTYGPAISAMKDVPATPVLVMFAKMFNGGDATKGTDDE